jgi:ribosomal protein S21
VADDSSYDFNTGQTSVICQFPQETVTSILVQNSVEDLLSFSMVCRQFKKWSSHSSIWNEIFKRTFGRECSRQNVKKELTAKKRAEHFMKKGKLTPYLGITGGNQIEAAKVLL